VDALPGGGIRVGGGRHELRRRGRGLGGRRKAARWRWRREGMGIGERARPRALLWFLVCASLNLVWVYSSILDFIARAPLSPKFGVPLTPKRRQRFGTQFVTCHVTDP
jgi:hypothetical protein